MINKLGIIGFVAILLISSIGVSYAEPRTVITTITNMRPYSTGGYFVTVASNQLNTGATCSTVYQVQGDAAGANAVIASLLTAYSLEQPIQIEIPTATGCVGFGTPIESIFMRP